MENIQKQLDIFKKTIKANANPDRAVQERRYLKSPFKFFGVSLPLTDKIAKEFRKSNSDAGRRYILELAQRLWDSEYHDEKRLGLRMLQFYPECLNLSAMPMLEKMLMQSTGWDLVDDISIHLVGTVLGKDKRAYAYLKKWSASDNFWTGKMIGEKEFFIRKAIGWGLREMAKANPGKAFDFLMKVKNKASGLTLREGSKRLPEKMKKAIMGK
jgi:3-methyladenine DNA glycosylase AlkD